MRGLEPGLVVAVVVGQPKAGHGTGGCYKLLATSVYRTVHRTVHASVNSVWSV